MDMFEHRHWKGEDGKYTVHAVLPFHCEALCGVQVPFGSGSCSDDPIECPECCNNVRAIVTWSKQQSDKDLEWLLAN